jgi:hypothetical protein
MIELRQSEEKKDAPSLLDDECWAVISVLHDVLERFKVGIAAIERNVFGTLSMVLAVGDHVSALFKEWQTAPPSSLIIARFRAICGDVWAGRASDHFKRQFNYSQKCARYVRASLFVATLLNPANDASYFNSRSEYFEAAAILTGSVGSLPIEVAPGPAGLSRRGDAPSPFSVKVGTQPGQDDEVTDYLRNVFGKYQDESRHRDPTKIELLGWWNHEGRRFARFSAWRWSICRFQPHPPASSASSPARN